MNLIQRFAVRAAAKIAPPLGKVLHDSGGTLDRLSNQLTVYRGLAEDRQIYSHRIKQELNEAMAMANGGPWTGPVKEVSVQDSKVVHPLKERLAELELALEDRGWRRQLAVSESEFSRYGIQQIVLISRLYFIKNPLIKRGVKVSAMYVFGRGVEISSDDETADGVLRAFFKDQHNSKELGHTALVAKEESLHTDGNLFLAFFASPEDGSVQIRSIDPLEIEEIICNPDDVSEPWFYHRRWTAQAFDFKSGLTRPIGREAWYADIDYPAESAMIKGRPLERDTAGQLIPILHLKVGSLQKWHFGCPMVYSALDWARAYKHFLEDWATITRALARFAWTVETQGGAPAIEKFKQSLATTLGMDGTSVESNPAPVAGSAFVTGPGNKLTPMKTGGATTEPEQGRRVMLMVAAAFGLPETFFGDASTGSLATARSLDRPTELQFLQRQEQWRELLLRVSDYVLERSAGAPKGRLREAKKQAKDAIVEVKFPSLLEHDLTEQVNAIVNAMTLAGHPVVGIDEKTGVGLLLQELGVEDVQSVLDAMYPEADYEPDRTIEPDPALTPSANGDGQAPQPKAAATEAQLYRATLELRRALTKLRETKTK